MYRDAFFVHLIVWGSSKLVRDIKSLNVNLIKY